MTAANILPEAARRRARDVRYFGGTWDQVRTMIPAFELRAFATEADAPANPFLKSVVRLPLNPTERAMPVGVVSNSYALVQHETVGKLCLDGMGKAGIEVADLKCEVGLSDFGEWMNLRVYFPRMFNFIPGDGYPLKLRIEAFNSVDGTSRLKVLLGWFRLVCSNGLVIGKSVVEIKDIHDENLDLTCIADVIRSGAIKADSEKRRLRVWYEHEVIPGMVIDWADDVVAVRWGKKAATRVIGICATGNDVEPADPFAPGKPSEKSVRIVGAVPGAPRTASNLYDVSQALSWVATRRDNAEQRIEWQQDIPWLIGKLRTFDAPAVGSRGA